MGVNEKELPDKTPVSFVLLDNHHLTEHGIRSITILINGIFLTPRVVWAA